MVAGRFVAVPFETFLGPDQFQPQPGACLTEDGKVVYRKLYFAYV
jgi:hypothetical protein